MTAGLKIAEVGALVGDPSRANILSALMDGRALTASELAYFAKVTPQTASTHLAKLAAGGILSLTRQGRHRYYRLASPLVGQMLESIMIVAEAGSAHDWPGPRISEELRIARLCYDHLAGDLGVGIADALVTHQHILLSQDGGELTSGGAKFIADLGVDINAAVRQRRVFCRPCLDWSVRRPHIAGALGAALAARLLELGWLRRIKDSRAIAITPRGGRSLSDKFGIRLPLKGRESLSSTAGPTSSMREGSC